jgi:hypothetical protein
MFYDKSRLESWLRELFGFLLNLFFFLETAEIRYQNKVNPLGWSSRRYNQIFLFPFNSNLSFMSIYIVCVAAKKENK